MRDGDEAGAARVHCPRLGLGSEGRVQVCGVAAPGISGTERDGANGGRETERQREWGWVHVALSWLCTMDESTRCRGSHRANSGHWPPPPGPQEREAGLARWDVADTAHRLTPATAEQSRNPEKCDV